MRKLAEEVATDAALDNCSRNCTATTTTLISKLQKEPREKTKFCLFPPPISLEGAIQMSVGGGREDGGVKEEEEKEAAEGVAAESWKE